MTARIYHLPTRVDPPCDVEAPNLYEAEFLQLDERNFGVREQIKDGLFFIALGLIAATTMGCLIAWCQS